MTDRLEPIPTTHALCVIGASRSTAPGRAARADAGFLTQLMAVTLDCEQFRQKRRAPVDVAITAYGRLARA